MLRVNSVSRYFDDRKVLDSVCFEVNPGRLTGFVGANGAGKTTTMRIILGVLAASTGEVTWNGRPLTRSSRQQFGYMPEERGLYPKMKIQEQLVYLGRLHGLTPAAALRNSRDLLERLGLADRAGDTVEKLSMGNQQRAQVAAALVHDPRLLVLDEPFSALDPNAVDTVVDVLQERAASGVPVLFSSHQLDVVERLCDDLVIISQGTIRAAGSRDELRRQHTGSRYEIVVNDDAGWLRDQPEVKLIDLDGPRAVFDLLSQADSDPELRLHHEQQVLAAAIARGAVRSFHPITPSLAEIFREITK
jgi:ABC-2 type transport system ATP-binding protein